MRILLSGGGSGGHLFPLIAVARKIKEFYSKMPSQDTPEFLFIGPDHFSKVVVQKEGIRSATILGAKVRFLFMPDVIFSKGGYASIPVVFWGWLFRIPIIIHESDSMPGLANRLLSRFAKRIIVSFQESARYFPTAKVIALGNPVREEMFQKIPDDARQILDIRSERPVIFVFGGSRGAREINDLLLLALPDLLKKYEIIHQCGEDNYKDMQKGAIVEIGDSNERRLYHLYASLHEEEIASAYKLAAVIVARAGAGAIFEIALSGKPSVLVPYAYSAGDHQEKNAHSYAKEGAAIVLEGENLKPHILINSIDLITENSQKAQIMSEAAQRFAKPDAAKRIAEELLKFA
ncbi:MAG: UDP-N-acetylglucosamine--N-acetylmuramyl-(pentapeptide) pyrophosphoryl-undecaprenol N-acetylglucosamine transferase [Candidatus Spechtbacteria bacterium]|nr:UDP-N-acetylglucosamine--N-acetylmuramyl-(pentapeptide) pyrophosphoryl-undecaprenol N-acetylglucosamine transferase [Candidatus Spechtbacteria bacterium]